MKHILCYGDSNTWGYIPGTGMRYDENTRWPCRLQKLLGEDWRIHEEGLNGRTSAFDDPLKPYLNGMTMLAGTLASQKPLDAVVLSLGTNDLKMADPGLVAQGVGALIDLIRAMDTIYPGSQPVFPSGPRILVVSPIQVGAELASFPGYSRLAHAHEPSKQFPAQFAAMCAQKGVPMIDASLFAAPSPTDCIHMEPEGHAALAEAIAQKLREML